MSIQWKLVILAALSLTCGCAERKYSNPLDPRNPETHGRPTGLRVYSVRDTVFLSWRRLELTGLEGVRIWRSEDGSDFRPVAIVSPGASGFADPGLQYGLSYRYFITVLGADFESAPSETLAIRPGPTSAVAVDPYVGLVTRYSYDVRHEIWESSLAAYPYDVAVDRRRGKVWVPDALEGSVWCLSLRSGDYILRAAGYWSPWKISLQPATGRVVIADLYGQQVVALDASGSELWRDNRFQRPSDVAAAGMGFWVLDRQTKNVAYYPSPGSEPMYSCPLALNDPRAIETDSKGLSLWLADATAIYSFDMRNGEWVAVMTSLLDVRALSLSPNGEQAWVLDGVAQSQFVARAIRLNRSGFVEAESRGWYGASDIAFDWATKGCVLANPQTHELVRLDSLGNVESRRTGLVRPTFVEVE
jgi:hypothetical protein